MTTPTEPSAPPTTVDGLVDDAVDRPDSLPVHGPDCVRPTPDGDYVREATIDGPEGVWAATIDTTTTVATTAPASTVQEPPQQPISALPATGGFEGALLVVAVILVGLGESVRRLARRR